MLCALALVVTAGCGGSDADKAARACDRLAASITTGPELVPDTQRIERRAWGDVRGRRHDVRRGFVVLCRFTARESAPAGFAPVYVADEDGRLLGEAQGSHR